MIKENLFSKAEAVLLKHWGFSEFRDIQKSAVESFLNHPHSLCILPTGGGKSIVYQSAALAMEVKTIVVSPLLALMEDQVANLKTVGISAINLSGFKTPQETYRLLENFQNGPFPFLFCSPEKLQSRIFQEMLPYLPYKALVIDEAHCVSDWGSYFRPNYRKISEALQAKPPEKILALTASAPPTVIQDIIQFLHLKEPQIVQNAIRRANIHLKKEESENPESRTLDYFTQKKGIAYAHFRSLCEKMTQQSIQNKIKAIPFHGGLDKEKRSEYLQNWLNNKYDVVYATSAFGMGIDKGDVAHVLHLNMPASLEHYYQEAGRGGRNGEIAEALFLYNKDMMIRQRARLASAWPAPEEIEQVYSKLCSIHQLAYEDALGVYLVFRKGALEKACPAHLKIRKCLEILEKAGFIEFNTTRKRIIQWEVDIIPRPIYGQVSREAEGFLRAKEHLASGRLEDVPQPFNQNDLKLLVQEGILDIFEPGTVTIRFPVERPRNFFHSFSKKTYKMAIQKLKTQQDWLFYYLKSDQCLWRILEVYFGEKPGKACGVCSNCKKHGDSELLEKEIPSWENRIYALSEAEINTFEPRIRYEMGQTKWKSNDI